MGRQGSEEISVHEVAKLKGSVSYDVLTSWRMRLPRDLRHMKLLFSEAKADYAHYIFPYAVWAFPEPGETPADLFAHGFLPSSRDLDRFYLCRQVRIDLEEV